MPKCSSSNFLGVLHQGVFGYNCYSRVAFLWSHVFWGFMTLVLKWIHRLHRSSAVHMETGYKSQNMLSDILSPLKTCQKLLEIYHKPCTPSVHSLGAGLNLAPGTTQNVCFTTSAGLRVTLLVKTQWKTSPNAVELYPLQTCGLGLWFQ